MNARRWFVGLVLVGASFVAASLDAAELAQAQRDKLVWIDQSLQKVVTFYRDKKTDDLKKLIGEIESAIDAVRTGAGGEDVEAVLNPFRIRLAAAQKLAAYVPPVAVKPVVKTPMPVAMPIASPSGTPTPGAPPMPVATLPLPAGKTVSFVKEIAPVLVKNCGGCHINRSSGNLNFATYAALMAGTGGTAVVVSPRAGAASVLVEKITNGEMPPGNPNAVSDAEVATLVKWITEGAFFDGTEPMATLPSLVPGAPGQAARPAAPQIVRASGNEKVKFTRHVAPILVTYCFDCHGSANGNDNRGGYSMYSFRQLLRGGDNGRGSAVKAGDPDGSMLIQAIRGTAIAVTEMDRKIQKMPPGRAKQPSAQDIETLITWIREGAKIEDPDEAGDSVEFLVKVDVAKLATHDELKGMRLEDSKKYWTRANRDSPFEILENNDFAIISNVGPVRMQEYMQSAEAEKAKLLAELKLPADKPIVKGRITLFIFAKSFEMGEFFTLVERKQIPPGLTAHWFFNWVDCYACLVSQPTPEETAPLISAAIAGSLIDSLGSKAPRWFSIGTARNIAGKLHAKTPVVKQWDDDFLAAGSALLTVNAIINTANPDPKAMAVSQMFVKDMMKQPAWATLVAGVVKGTKFADVFQSAFKTDPQKVFEGWMKKFK